MEKKKNLISEYDEHFKSDEPVHGDFISRKNFINRTGIYISTMNYDMVYDEFKESGLSVDEFVNTYEDNHPIEEVQLNGVFKYDVTDEGVNGLGTYDESHFVNIWEIVNAIDMEFYHKWTQSDKIIHKAMKIIDEQEHLLSDAKNILLEIQKSDLAIESPNGGQA